ncbi:uncharacterized protein LOC135471810 [Liolophura sinensis]|uniref:uncharacterized protein LOC135471810 n=1 Tax=Liolophura sinensis TaxID=3198878 RepID=UPI0031592BA7
MDRVVTLSFLFTVAMCTVSAAKTGSQEKPDLPSLTELQELTKHWPNIRYVDEPFHIRPNLLSLFQSQYYKPGLSETWRLSDILENAMDKRSEGNREKKERELAYLLHNLILELDSDEAKNLSGTRRFKSVSGESSGEMTRGPVVEAGSKRKYGNIFHGPLETKARTAPRPRRQRKFRIDPVMFWMGIGK